MQQASPSAMKQSFGQVPRRFGNASTEGPCAISKKFWSPYADPHAPGPVPHHVIVPVMFHPLTCNVAPIQHVAACNHSGHQVPSQFGFPRVRRRTMQKAFDTTGSRRNFAPSAKRGKQIDSSLRGKTNYIVQSPNLDDLPAFESVEFAEAQRARLL